MRFRGARRLIASALVVASALAVSGCGGSNTLTTPQTGLAVISVTPATGSTGVAVTAPVTATFNEVLSGTTLNSSTFTLTPAGGAAVIGNVSYSAGSSTAVFTPASPLAYNTVYTATLTTGVQNPAGTALGANYTLSFTTATGPAPTVSAVTPGDGSAGVAAGTTVTATFSEAMNASTITASTFTLTPQGGAALSATVSYNAATFTATLTPKVALAINVTYTAAVTTGVVGATGSALANVDSWSFTTAQGPVPTVTTVTPATGATLVPINSTVVATFSEKMDTTTVNNSTFTLTGGGASVTGTIVPDTTGTIFTFTPTAPLAYNTTYTALITTGVLASSTGLPEVPLAADYTWSFTTPPIPAATVTAVTPATGTTGVAITGTTVTATFGAAMTSTTINPSTFTLTGPGGVVVGAVTYNATTFTATLTPSVSLAYGAKYTATIGTGATTALGGTLSTPYTWSFTTVTATAPTVASVTPANTTPPTTGVAISSAVSATFSEPMNGASLNTSTFTLTATGFPPVTGTVTYDTGAQTATFTPSATLAPSTTYTATITTGAQGATGAALASKYTWTFTTGTTPIAVAVSYGTTYQTIRGFGGASVWLGKMPTKAAPALFGSGPKDLNLSILRVRIDPEGTATGTTGTTYNDPYETYSWDYELFNAQQAIANNPNAIVFASPWTAPASMKTSSTSQPYMSCSEGAGYCGGYLNPTSYAAYATYLEDFVSFFNTNAGTNPATGLAVNLYAVSMQNEPDANETYESMVWTPQQMDNWVSGYASTITSDPYTTKLIMPESESFTQAQAAPTLNDPAAEGLVSIIGGHLYGTQPSAYPIPAGDTPKELWMTEYGPLSTATLTFAQALSPYGVSIHNSMVNGQYNAYVWWGMWGSTTNTCATAAGTCGLVDFSGNLQPMGEIMGQYSKFVQPGYQRASATANPAAGINISAYTGLDQSGNQHYVIVAINTNGTAQNLNFTLSDAPMGITSMTPTQSTSAGGLVAEPAVTVTGGQFYYTLPATSITTFFQ